MLLCTLGNSLLNAIEEKRSSDPAAGPQLGIVDVSNPISLAKCVKDLDDGDDCCGAEINSIAQMEREGYVECPALALELLAQDTERARLIAGAVSEHEAKRRFLEVQVHYIPGLQDDDHNKFRRAGLRTLLLLTADRVAWHQARGHRIGINATGGLKAQVSLVTLLGQMFGVPVFYQSRKFERVVRLPPVPVAPDVSLWLENSTLFWDISEETMLPRSELQSPLAPSMEMLLEEEDGMVYLSPVGLLYHEYCCRWFEFQSSEQRPPARDAPPVVIHTKDHHRPPGFEAFVELVARECDFVTRIFVRALGPGELHYRQRFKAQAGENASIAGTYSGSGFHCHFDVLTTARRPSELACAVVELNRRYPA